MERNLLHTSNKQLCFAAELLRDQQSSSRKTCPGIVTDGTGSACRSVIRSMERNRILFRALRDCAAERTFNAADDSKFSASYLPDLTNACLDLLIDGEAGIWHMTNPGETSWAEVAETVAWMSGFSWHSMKRCRTADLRLQAERPLYSVLETSRGILLPPLADALSRYVMVAKSKPEFGKVAA